MFYRTVRASRTANGTPYTECFWWRGVWEVTVSGVTIKNLTPDEYQFFHRTF